MTQQDLLADVALRGAADSGRGATLTYSVPVRLRPLVQPGQLVWVPLRRQRVQAVVLDIYDASESWERRDRIRDIADLADLEASITPIGLRLAQWLARYYRAPLFDALTLFLPPGVGQQAEVTWRATPRGELVDLGSLPERERGILYYLRQHGETSERKLNQALRGGTSELQEAYASLFERGLLNRGAAISAPRVQPLHIRMVRLLLSPPEVPAALEALQRAPKQALALRWLVERTHLFQELGLQAPNPEHQSENEQQPIRFPMGSVVEEAQTTSSIIRQLAERGFVAIESQEVRRDPLAGDGVAPDLPPPLTNEQREVWGQISDALDRTPHEPVSPFLLHGVTGSGKTEIYLRAIGRALRQKKQSLVLVPEIALTEQLVRRFAARFPGQIAVLHSGLSLGQRYDEWRRLRRGEARVAIGSRSAVFAPLPDIGLIIIDEEHEGSYKHDNTPRYHARDVALQLAKVTNSVLILGSATPSIESFYAAQRGRYELLSMHERVAADLGADGVWRSRTLSLPPVQLVDMRFELHSGNRSIFSQPLQEAIAARLERREQSILFLNRRGASSFVMCRDCGHVLSCPTCSGPLVVHFSDEFSPDQRPEYERNPHIQNGPRSLVLICHSCNYQALVPMICPECLSIRIKDFGIGTQRVEEEVKQLFPDARVIRWDRDSAAKKGSHARMLDAFLNHEADILIGTQMIAKGLDLPLVSLVGIVTADTGLHLPDFRSGERTFQLLTQVAGRAGRRLRDAQVILQTYTPEHYALQAALEHDYLGFYTEEIAFRRQTGYPPFGRLVRFVYTSGNEERCKAESKELARRINLLIEQREQPDEGLIGPAPAFFERVRGRYRWHMLVRSQQPHAFLDALGPTFNWSVDIDPINVL
jgi:primosomal protein N' (replication factor Y)